MKLSKEEKLRELRDIEMSAHIDNLTTAFSSKAKSILTKDDLFQSALKPIRVMDIDKETKLLMIGELIHYIISRSVKESKILTDQQFYYAQCLFDSDCLELAEKYLKEGK